MGITHPPSTSFFPKSPHHLLPHFALASDRTTVLCIKRQIRTHAENPPFWCLARDAAMRSSERLNHIWRALLIVYILATTAFHQIHRSTVLIPAFVHRNLPEDADPYLSKTAGVPKK
jgi:hypothetical protein